MTSLQLQQQQQQQQQHTQLQRALVRPETRVCGRQLRHQPRLRLVQGDGEGCQVVLRLRANGGQEGTTPSTGVASPLPPHPPTHPQSRHNTHPPNHRAGSKACGDTRRACALQPHRRDRRLHHPRQAEQPRRAPAAPGPKPAITIIKGCQLQPWHLQRAARSHSPCPPPARPSKARFQRLACASSTGACAVTRAMRDSSPARGWPSGSVAA